MFTASSIHLTENDEEIVSVDVIGQFGSINFEYFIS